MVSFDIYIITLLVISYFFTHMIWDKTYKTAPG